MKGAIKMILEKAATILVLVAFALVIPSSSALFLASCSSQEPAVEPQYSMWCTAAVNEIVNTPFHIFRDNSYTGIDDNGYCFVTSNEYLGSVRVIEPFEGRYRAYVTASSVHYDELGDSFAYVINGQGYFEVNTYSSNSAGIDTEYYEIDTNEMCVVGKVDLIEEDGLVTTGVWQTKAGTVMAEELNCFQYLSEDPSEYYVYLFDKDGGTLRFSLNEITEDTVYEIKYAAALSENEIVVSYMTMTGIEDTVLLKAENNELTLSESPVPAYLKRGVRAYDAPDGGLYIKDSTGIYSVAESDVREDAPQFEMIADWTRCDGDINVLSSLTPFCKNENGALCLYGLTLDNVEYQQTVVTASVAPCEFPYDGRQEITVGFFEEMPGSFGNNIQSFNRSNSQYYVRPVFISTEGVDPLIDFSESENTFDISSSQLEALKFHAYRNYIQSADAPDVVITDGMQAQLQSSNLFIDLNGYIDSDSVGLNRDDFYNNIFTRSEVGGQMFTLPLYYYIDGIVEYDPYHTYIVPSGNITVESLTYEEYENKVNNEWDGIDPMGEFLSMEDVFNDLICVQYTDFVDLATHDSDFSGADFEDILEFSAQYVSGDEDPYVTYISADSGVMYTSICYVDDFVYCPYYIDTCKWMGLPSSDGNSLPSIGVVNAAGITNSCDDKDAAWSFISYLLSVDSQEDRRGIFGLPVNRIASENSLRYPRYSFELVEEFTDNATGIYYYDSDLNAVSNEVIEAYAAGEITAEEAGEMLNSQIIVKWT